MSTYTMAQIKNLWLQAGGSATAATMAAAVAMAESGGDPNANNNNGNGSIDRGLWQINSIHGSQSTYDPLANAKAAVAISQNGTTWRPWCVAWSTGLCSGTYLGTGAPVFKFLQGQGSPIDTVGVPTPAIPAFSNPLSPQTWADAFLKPIFTQVFYGGMVLLGAGLMGWGLWNMVLQTATARTLINLGITAGSRGMISPGTGKGQAGRAVTQGVKVSAANTREQQNRATADAERQRRERESDARERQREQRKEKAAKEKSEGSRREGYQGRHRS